MNFYGVAMGMTKQEIKDVKHKDYAAISQYKTKIIYEKQHKVKLMSEVLECVYEKGVFKPLGKVIEIREGEKVKVRIEKKIEFEPIKLKKRVTIERIMEIRNELWTSS